MIRKINTIYRLNMNSIPFLRSTFSLFFLIVCLFSCLSSPTFCGGESPEVIEEIRSFLRTKTAQRGQQKVIADKLDIKAPTLCTFIKNNTNSPTLIKNFKSAFPEEYAKFTGAPPSASSQTQAAKSEQSSQLEPIKAYPCLDLCQLPFHPSFPDTYSLFMVDSSLIPLVTITDWEQHAHFADIGRRFLRPCLAGDENISFATTEQEAQKKTNGFYKTKKIFLL